MGFLTPELPPIELDQWRAKPHLERLKPLAQDWATNGFGTPWGVYLLYLVKLVVFSVGAALVIAVTTPGLGGLGDVGAWWTEPFVFEKLAVWTMLWEIIGLGCGSMPLTFRFAPMIGGILYWLRPGTVRLAPWPEKVPLTAGSRRTAIDVLLYAGILVSLGYLLLSDGTSISGFEAGRLDPVAIAVPLVLLGLLGLRDKVAFLASRPEVYGFLLLVFLFPISNLFVACQIVFVCIWWGAASSKLNHHFPHVIAVMVSNTPWNRSRTMKAKLWEDYPADMRPSRLSALAAHAGTVVEFTLPLVLLLSRGGTIGWLAVIGMVLFHVHITSTFPLGVPLEWNLFMIFGLFFLFGHYGDVPFSTLDDPGLIVLLLGIGVGLPALGNVRPDLLSFLPSMRYYAGNWAASQWLFRKDAAAEEKLDRDVYKVASVVVEQLTKFYDRETAELMLNSGLAFRAMHTHGRALLGLLPRAVDDVEAYDVREGELIAGVVTGWNFGDGHLHDHRLLAAVQEQCNFAAGELRIVTLESQPIHVQRQRYRIYDAATGLVEEGTVAIADMLERGPWLEGSWEFPVDVSWRADAEGRAAAPAAA